MCSIIKNEKKEHNKRSQDVNVNIRIYTHIHFIYIIYKANSLESQLNFKLNNKKNIVERENELFTRSGGSSMLHYILDVETLTFG